MHVSDGTESDTASITDDNWRRENSISGFRQSAVSCHGRNSAISGYLSYPGVSGIDDIEVTVPIDR